MIAFGESDVMSGTIQSLTRGGIMFEALEFVEIEETPGVPNPTPAERLLGRFETEEEAVIAGRAEREEYLAVDHDLYAWWIVRREGEQLASWIADSVSRDEFELDLRTGRLMRM